MLDFLQPIFPFVFTIAWVEIGFVLYLRLRRKQVVYLRRFPPIDRYQTLDMYLPGLGSPRGAYGRIRDATYHRQSDPDLERLRREIWHDFRLLAFGSSGSRCSPSAWWAS